MKLPLRRSCKEAARLVSLRLEKPLSLPDRIALRFHMMACKACPPFERQVRLMDQAMDKWRAYADRGD